MWGKDHIFGVFEEPYLEEWLAVGDKSYWRHWPCDDKGWPIHGHLVWASPQWWERKFRDYGLVRDIEIEQAIHRNLAGFFKQAIGRRCLFVLRRATNHRSSTAVAAADAQRACRVALGISPRVAADRLVVGVAEQSQHYPGLRLGICLGHDLGNTDLDTISPLT